jgi:hypothetical protein
MIYVYLDVHTSVKSEPRICSIILPPGVEPIGISLQSDTDFSHIITQVQLNSLADRAGIEQNDCIISLNNTFLLHLPFEDVLYYLAKTRNERKLDFLVAKKSYLLKSSQNHLTSTNPVFTSSNLTARHRSSTLPATQTFEQISYKYNYEQSRRNQEQQKIITDEEHDHLSLQIYSHLNVVKRKKKHGKILEGIGPATALRFSWSDTSEKTIDYSSIRSDLHGRKLGNR